MRAETCAAWLLAGVIPAVRGTVLGNYIPKLVAAVGNGRLQAKLFFTSLCHIRTGKHNKKWYLELTVLFSCLPLAGPPVRAGT